MVETYENPATDPVPAAAKPPVNESPKRTAFPVIFGGGLLIAIAVALVSDPQPVPASGAAAEPTAAKPAAAEPAAGAPTEAAKAPAAAEETKSLKPDLEAVSKRLDELQGRVEALPKPAPPAEIEPLQKKVADLAKANEATAALPKQVADLNDRVAAVDKSIADLKGEIGALRDEIKKAGTPAAAAASTETAKPADTTASDDALGKGLDLYKANKFKDANDAFKKLTETYPDDARVWYYAALSNGQATNDWKGETLRLVNKGVEREKAVTPAAAKIDAAFTDLIPASKTWLDYYRKTAQR